MNILINDGISPAGIAALEKANFKLFQTKVAQSQLANYINKNTIEIILVGSNTQIRKELIDQCPQLKLIGCSSIELDPIDVAYAEKRTLKLFIRQMHFLVVLPKWFLLIFLVTFVI